MRSRQEQPSSDGSSAGSSTAGGTDPSNATGEASVRRALALGAAGADPGPLLAPAARQSEAATQGESEETTRSRPDLHQSEAAVARPATVDGTAARATTAAATGQSSDTTAEPSSTQVQAQAASVARRDGVGAVVGGASDAGSRSGENGPFSGNPKKPVLAAAGIAGALLITVPLLIWATGDSDEKKDSVAAVGADTVLDDNLSGVPQGEYLPESPSPSPSRSTPKNGSPKNKPKESFPPVPAASVTGQPATEGTVQKRQKKVAPMQSAPPPVVPASNVLLVNTYSKKCANIPGHEAGDSKPGDGADQWTCQTPDNQRWNLEVQEPNLGPGGQPLFLIRNVKSKLCMDLPGTGAQPITTKVFVSGCHSTTSENQLWWLDKQPSGAYWIRNYASNHKCLDVSDLVTSASRTDLMDGTRLTIYDCSNTDDQEWKIVRS